MKLSMTGPRFQLGRAVTVQDFCGPGRAGPLWPEISAGPGRAGLYVLRIYNPGGGGLFCNRQVILYYFMLLE